MLGSDLPVSLSFSHRSWSVVYPPVWWGVDLVVGLVVGLEMGGATFPWEIRSLLCCPIRAARFGASTGVCAGYVDLKYSPLGQSMGV